MSVEWRSELFRKYDIPGPRYTSYPTVPYWDVTPTQSEWLDHLGMALSGSPDKVSGAAVYIHVPFCAKKCSFCGCNSNVVRNRDIVREYSEAVCREWHLYGSVLGRDKPITIAELHLGGGTPTFLSPAELEALLVPILEGSRLAPDVEMSVEVDPRVTSGEHLSVLAGLGFRRISVGIQDFDVAVQRMIGRVQTVEQVESVVSAARAIGFGSVNCDLLHGLPLQTEDSIKRTFSLVRRLKPDRMAFYAYAHVPWMRPLQRKFRSEDIPVGDAKRALYERGRECLEAGGYREVGMDHFALPSDSLWSACEEGRLHRNFMGYLAKRVSPVIGLGPSAIGDSWSAFAQNEKEPGRYVERVTRGELPIERGHVLTAEDLVLRSHILNLMTRFQTSWCDPQYMTPYLEDVPGKLGSFIADGLIELGEASLRITGEGRPFVRNISMVFDARLSRKAPGPQLFSKTI